ncbi:uncharacterized protein LOC102675054 isoform X1 [Apis dorsata]|uniref:uncharacterized protein LOC102675054 isoform X1 n=2 Tax=Apis dorsata TaxID=7462 RepID=UPI0003DF7ACF|nr:uncharacterized protein LOC102675054 isoform X1 [Apis dorsata]
MIPPLSVASRFPDCVDWQKMRTVAVWTAFVLAYSSTPFVTGIRYIDPISAQSGNTGDIAEKRVDLTEPTCEELRAMWRYTKRQSRAAKTTTGYSLYPDPFSYNVWKSYSEYSKPNLNYRGKFMGKPRNRAGGSAPIYGKIVHKAPASRLRNGMRHSPRLFNKIPRFFGTMNSYPPLSKSRINPIVGPSHLSQAGSFQHLKELLRAERARELQEQYKAEELAEKTSTFKDSVNNEYPFNIQQSQKQYLKSTLGIPTKINYEFGQGRYASNNGQIWTRNGPQPREYLSR